MSLCNLGQIAFKSFFIIDILQQSNKNPKRTKYTSPTGIASGIVRMIMQSQHSNISLILIEVIISLFIIFNIQTAEALTEALSCVDDDGRPIDWFIAYKFPEIRDSSNKQIKSGYAYSYLTSDGSGNSKKSIRVNSPRGDLSEEYKNRTRISKVSRIIERLMGRTLDVESSSTDTIEETFRKETPKKTQIKTPGRQRDNGAQWTLSDKLITDDDSLVLRSISPAYKRSKENSNRKSSDNSLGLIFYNDQPPAGGPSSNDDCAHSKGVVLMDETSGRGIWLTHSTPRFPPQHLNELKFEKNAAVNGQTFMCVTFDITKMGDKIAKHLVTMRPQVYDSELSEKLLTIVPEFRNLKIGRRRSSTSKKQVKDDHLHQTIESLNGQKLDLFSKSKDFKKDLYSDWLADELNSDLFVETWRIGGGTPLNSSCPLNEHKVNNISDLKINLDSHDETDWQYTHDHSKWAISQKGDHSQVCIGDINRMHSQFRRGGGTMCIRSEKGWRLFRGTIKDFEKC